MPPPDQPAAETEAPVDMARLAAWMDDQGLEAGPIRRPQMLGGGTQNIIMRFARGDGEFVLRRPPLHLRANSNQTMAREARVLGALASSDVPHPRLIAACDDLSVLGAAFYLMEPIEGFNAITGLPRLHARDPRMRRSMGLALAEGAAALGAVDYLAVGLSDFGKPDGFLERQTARWLAQLESYVEHAGWPGPAGIPGVERVGRWLDDNLPASSYRPGIIHGDYHIANVMFRANGPQLAAIVDWELATIGDPLLDLGWMLALWPDIQGDLPEEHMRIEPWSGFPAANELIAHYADRSARDVSAITWYAVLACFKLGIILEGTYARACAGKAPTETGDRLHTATLRLFGRALGWMAA